MKHLYSIVDNSGSTSTFFEAENDAVAKRQFLLSVCRTPFWSDFSLFNTGVDLHDDGTAEVNFSELEIACSQEEVDSYLESVERASAVRARAYAPKESVK